MGRKDNERGIGVEVPELLAPAGDLQTAITAFESGADAVYAGLGKFNAREMAHNFSYDDMSRLSAFAKRRGKRFYLTFNTLVKEIEIEEAASELERAITLDPDGVIVQDIGIAALIRDLFPLVEIHASTQMGIHNSYGVESAAAMGISRVIIERQVRIDELRSIVETSPIDIEVFVHGALCCSLSGRCLFSSWIGGWSGNRGKCKQPCRRRYHYQEGGRNNSSGFFFSTQDLYTLDLLEELTDIGVSSLKIEGRLKKSGYIASVVGAYRMGLDAVVEGKRGDISQAKMLLSNALGRRWSHGFATEEEMKSVVQPASLGVSGLLIGEVEGKDGGEGGGIDLKLSRTLYIGDRIRIQSKSGDESPSITVKKMYQRGSSVKKVKSGRVRIEEQVEVPVGGRVYKISTATRTPGPSAEKLPYYTPKAKLDIEIEVAEGEIRGRFRPHGVSEEDSDFSPWWKRPLLTEPAKNRALDSQELEEQFSVSRSEILRAEKIEASCQNSLFVPAGELKKARREFWEWVSTKVPANLGSTDVGVYDKLMKKLEELEGEHRRLADAVTSPIEKKNKSPKAFVSCITETGEERKEFGDAEQGSLNCSIFTRPLYSMSSSRESAEKKSRDISTQAPNETEIPNETELEIELPHFTPQEKIEELRNEVVGCYERGIRRFRLTDLSHLTLFERLDYGDVELSMGYPLPITNSLAASELAHRGISRVLAWVELEKEAIEEMIRRNPVRTEIYLYGRPFLLTTRAEISVEGFINDPRGRKFYVHRDEVLGLYYILPYEIFSIPPSEIRGDAVDYLYDLRNIYIDPNAEKSTFNFTSEMV